MPPKPPLYGSPLLAILRGGKEAATQQPVFGMPLSQPTFPTALPQTANTTRQNVQPQPFQAPQPAPAAPVINPLDIIRQGKEQVIRQGAAPTTIADRTGIFGGTGRAEMPAVNERIAQTISRSVRERGLLPAAGDFLFGEFNKLTAPNPKQYTDMWVEDRDKLIAKGYTPERAEQVATQNIFNQTTIKDGATMSGKAPVQQTDLGVELTPEERGILRGGNIMRKALAGLDAPIFLGTTKPISLGAKGLIKPARYTPDMVEAVTDFADVANGVKKVSPEAKKEILATGDSLAEALAKAGYIEPDEVLKGHKALADTLRKHMDKSNEIAGDVDRPAKEAAASRTRGAVSDVRPAKVTDLPAPRPGAIDIKPVNQKLADFRAGKPSSQGGYAANPFTVTPQGVKPTGPKIANSGDAVAFDRAANGLMKESWTKLREVMQDNWVRAKNLQRTPGVKVDKGANPYLAETLFHGRVHTRLQEVKDNVIKIDKEIVGISKRLGTKSEELTKTINKYLQATHAPERNAKLGDGAAGITTKEAQDFIASVDASSMGKEVKRVTDELLELNRRTLTTLKEAQVIDSDTFTTLTETYKNHVPLNRILETTDDITQALSGRGFSVRGSGIQRAKGSDMEVADIITNITTNVEQAIIRAEKNLVDLQTLKFARNNQQLGLFEELKPKVMGLDFQGKPIMQQVNDPQVLSLRENGKPVYLKINDPHMAAMYQNVNPEHMPNMMQWIATFTRLYSSLHTRFNYEFAFSNKVRDIQEMAVDMASRKEMGFKQAGKAITKEPESIKAVTDFIRGKDTEGARLYKQLQMDGGTTGGLSLSTRKQVEVDIEKIRQLNRSQPRRAARMLLEAVDNWNTIFEDSTRLSVYKTALQNGTDRETAAMLAKESTVNFNKKGTGGSVINGLYMFSNASIQGTTKMLRAMKNPKVAGAVVGGMGLAVYNLNKFNDSVDPEWRSKVTEFDRTSNMVIFLPSETGEARYVTIPVSWGLKPIKVAMEHANDLMTGHNDSVPDAVRGIMVAAATAYNPLAGSENVVETLTPTFLKTPQEIASNVAWHGGKIRPDYDPNMPKSAQFFKSLENKATGRIAIDATEKLADATGGEIQISPANVNYAFEAYIGGLGRSVTKILNTITSIGKGDDLKPSEIPIASRFYKVRDTEQTETQRIYSVLDDERKDRSASVYEADRTFRDLKQLPAEEQKARLKEIAVSNPDLLKQLETRYKKDKWTPQERALSSLTNARKAEYLLTRLPDIPREERRAFLADLISKGVISENVLKEMETQRGIISQ